MKAWKWPSILWNLIIFVTVLAAGFVMVLFRKPSTTYGRQQKE